MKQLVRSFVIVIGVLLGVAFLPAPAHAADNNAAVAINTKDGSSIFKVAFSIKRISDGTVDPQNAAVAYSNCSDCQTVAVAIQIVLVTGDTTDANPTNLAIAYNDNCVSCATMAAAYQFVFSTGTDVKLSPEGKKRLHDLRKQLHDLRKAEGLSLDEINARLEVIVQGIADVLADELLPASDPSSTTTTSTTGPDASSTTSSSSSSTTSSTSSTVPASSTSTSAP